MNNDILQRLAAHMGTTLSVAFELESNYPKLFEFFENEIRSLEQEVENLQIELAGEDY